MALLEMIHSGWISQAIHVAARLGIADELADGPKTGAELAARIGAHADSVCRLLRALTTLGLCAARHDGAFELAPLGSYLRSDSQQSLRAVALHWGGSMWPIWGTLLHTVKTGQSPRALVTRRASFESQDSEPMRLFNDAMTEVSRLMAEGLVRGYDFSAIRSIVDVGGGQGELLAAILGANPGMRGVLFDLLPVLDGARKHLDAAGVTDRCELVPGSFFESVPAGADAYLLKSVLHDWDDDRAAAILCICRRAMAGRGRLLVVERVLPERMETSAAHRFMAASDLGMMIAVSGRERTEADFRALLRTAAFDATAISATALHYSVIEAECS